MTRTEQTVHTGLNIAMAGLLLVQMIVKLAAEVTRLLLHTRPATACYPLTNAFIAAATVQGVHYYILKDWLAGFVLLRSFALHRGHTAHT